MQKGLLEKVKDMLPSSCSVLLAGDRFYGTSSLIGWCAQNQWRYRIRLKSNLTLEHGEGIITAGEAATLKIDSLEGACFAETRIKTNIGIFHEKGHKEPWIIVMDCKSSQYKVLDYGIECLFSDFKSRGFSITKTQLKQTDRIERLILILTIVLYWAFSTGMKPRNFKTKPSKKLYRSTVSFFKKGLRFILNLFRVVFPAACCVK